MGLLPLLLLSLGLSFDTFAISVGYGLVEKKIKFIQASKIAAVFAFFQAVMPIIGCFLGFAIKKYIVHINYWIAFGLLFFIGAKMIYDSFQNEDVKKLKSNNIKVLLLLSLATTVDAFALGVTFALLDVNLVFASLIIGVVTYSISMLGILFGKNIGSYFSKKVEIIGGLILIAIGLKFLIEYLMQ